MDPEPLICDHSGGHHSVCTHLLADPEQDYHRWFTGRGKDFNLLCAACAKAPLSAVMRSVCDACLAKHLAWCGCVGVVGQPAIPERSSGIHFDCRVVQLPQLTDAVVTARPIVSASGNWLVLTDSALVGRLDTTEPSFTPLTQLATDNLDSSKGLDLQASSDGRFFVICERSGRFGSVHDVAAGKWTMRLDRDDYCVEHRGFGAAFFQHDGRTLLVHSTAWNRLDISVPATGELLTPRGPTSYKGGEPRPAQYLDYFHCRVTISPTAEYIAEDGWVWHPYGSPRVWNLRQSIEQNPWESEDGPSVRSLSDRAYAWDQPLCWVDEHTLAVYGFGEDELCLLPAALLFDVRTGKLLRWFPGPRGEFYFDRFLFSISPEFGTSVWDTTTGDRLVSDPQHKPIAYHEATREFLTPLGPGEFELSTLVP